MSWEVSILARAAEYARSYFRDNSTLWRWATVTSVGPVKIQYDGATVPALITPTVLGAPVGVGDRVRTATVRGKTVIWKADTGGTPFAMAAGMVTIPGGNGALTQEEVLFPPGRFTVAPNVTLQYRGTNAATGLHAVTGVYNESASGFTAYMIRDASTATTFYWQAVQMTPTSAEG